VRPRSCSGGIVRSTTRYHGYIESSNESLAPWDSFHGHAFPFVEISLDRRITTIVGANESGKSHLLSAVAKVFTGKSVGDDAEQEYAIQDICRYCAFEGLEENIWPHIGIELTFDSAEEYQTLLKSLGFTVPTVEDDGKSPAKRCVVILDGSQSDQQFAQAFSLPSYSALGSIPKSKWRDLCDKTLPAFSGTCLGFREKRWRGWQNLGTQIGVTLNGLSLRSITGSMRRWT
jgi:hypothetical protein